MRSVNDRSVCVPALRAGSNAQTAARADQQREMQSCVNVSRLARTSAEDGAAEKATPGGDSEEANETGNASQSGSEYDDEASESGSSRVIHMLRNGF